MSTNPRKYTPCIGICSTTLGDFICRGCHRTREEIDRWNTMTQEERDVVWRRLEEDHGIQRGVNRHPSNKNR